MPRGSARRWEIAIIYIIASVIAGVLLYAFLVMPELNRYNRAVEEYNSQQQRNLRATGERDVLVEEYVKLKARADSTEKLLFENQREADIFLEELPKMSEKTGNILTSIVPRGSKPMASPKPQNPKKGEPAEPSPLTKVATMPVALNIVGGYGDMINLFGDFEEYKRLMDISQVSVGGARGGGGDVRVNFSLSLIHSRAGAARTREEEKIAQIVKSVQDEKAAQVQVAKITEPKPPAQKVETSNPTKTQQRQIVRRPPGQDTKPPNLSGESGETGPREGSTEREQKAGWRSVKYSFKVTVPSIEGGRRELETLLRSMNYEPWVWSGLAKATAPYPLLVGKFNTKDEAYAFGELVQERLPSMEGYGVKRVTLDYDSVLKETRVEVED